jgi:hypothetical protein
VNYYQGVVMHTSGWVLVLLDGWAMHTHWVAVIGFVLLIYSMWSICMKTPEDEAFDDIHKAQGWRKRQIEENISIEDAFNDWDHSHRPEQYHVQRQAFHAGWVAAMRRKHD